ncbi:hypothetical protein PAEVO_52360 [Paenibacillus sp. GM2FR]|uniref:HEPN domain-containing protein n=1 Tax=Paenibacillus sp. GM2FR TaxID=2059268 RepID=UPI000C2767A8|nr:HEPN domain-containing protein [Paenibacillus sp. GM2FR]PJN50192.1 hypothetical protein PAEVO_52360 [Paenibacillus sp. GM2FR]
MNTNNLKQALIRTVGEINENKGVPLVTAASSIKYLNVYIPMEYWRAKSFKDTLNKFLKDVEIANNLSTTQIIITLNSMIKALLESEKVSQDAALHLEELKKKLENAREYIVYVPIKGVRMYIESYDFGIYTKIVSISEERPHELLRNGRYESLDYLKPTALEFRIKSADNLKAMELAVEGSKYILHFLRLIDYLTWDEESLGLGLPGFGTSTDELRVTALEGEMEFDWRLKEAAEEEFDIDPAFREDAKKYGVQKFSMFLDAFFNNSQTEIGKSVMRSLVWFGESRIDHDIASRFLKLMLAIECLLNTNDDAPITATLSERVAFVQGEKIDERLNLVKEMKRLYKIRSKITHHGSTEAGLEDLGVLEEVVSELIVIFLTNAKYDLENKAELNQMFERLKYS